MFYLITIRCFYQLTIFFLLPRCYTMQMSMDRTTNMLWAWANSCTPLCFCPHTRLSYPWSIHRCSLPQWQLSVCEMEVVPLQTLHSILPPQQQIQVVVEVNDRTRMAKAKCGYSVVVIQLQCFCLLFYCRIERYAVYKVIGEKWSCRCSAWKFTPLAGDAAQGQSTHKHTHKHKLIVALAA